MSGILLNILAISIAMLIILITLWNRVINTGLNLGDNTCLDSSENEGLSKPHSKVWAL